MGTFVVISDSSCDLTEPMAKKHMVEIIPLKVSFDRINKLAEGIDISVDEFYTRLQTERKVPKTYYPTVREYVRAFKEVLNEGKDVICLCLSSKLSKGYECACNARDILSHSFKHNKVVVMDTLMATGAQAALTLNAVKFRDTNLTVDDAYTKLVALRDDSFTVFTVSSLEQLARGGRMSKATAAIGSLLHINPIIHLENGELVSREKALGRAKAINMIQKLSVLAINKKINDYVFTVFHSRSLDEAKKIEHNLQAACGVRFFNPIIEVGVSIGAHTGSSMLAINCMKRI